MISQEIRGHGSIAHVGLSLWDNPIYTYFEISLKATKLKRLAGIG